MDRTCALLLTTPLFAGISAEQLSPFLTHLHPLRRQFGKGEHVIEYGQRLPCIGIVLSGRIEAWSPLPAGGHIAMASMGPGGVFNDVLSGSRLKSPVVVSAAAPCEVLLLPREALLRPRVQQCSACSTFLQNLMTLTGQKYFALFKHLEVLMMPSLRGKISAYLLGLAQQTGIDTFQVEGTRAQMAAYLGCDRSALSRELSRMQAAGLIETYKNSFKLLDKAALDRCCQGEGGK